jgi:hypothetical protein
MYQVSENGNLTGQKMPKGLSASEQIKYLMPTADAKLSQTTAIHNHDTASGGDILSSNTSIRNNNATQAGENSRDKNKASALDITNFFKPDATTQPTTSKIELPKSKIFKVGNSSVNGTLDPATGKYFTMVNGVKNLIKE